MPPTVVYKPTETLQPIYAGGGITPPKFMPTYLEWLFKDAEAIAETSSGGIVSGGIITFYTVPEGVDFYITSCFLECWGTAGTNRLTLQTPDNKVEFLTVVSSNVGTTANVSANYSHPIVLPSKTVIKLINHHLRATQFAMGMTGFLIEKKAIPAI